jgi:dolichyl-phosphate beta-glucosyltransferase
MNIEKAIDISVIIPAFNEAKRLPLFLDRLISYCRLQRDNYEIIVVDDGSSDDTSKCVARYRTKFSHLYIVRIRRNRGKGYAVKRGFLRATGKVCLFLDADGSVSPEEIEKNMHYIEEGGYDIFIGSRVLKEHGQVLKVKWYRKFVGVVFNFCVQTFLFKNIKDTQCGFKMFKKEVVKPLFSRSYIRGFGFDIEILYLAHKMGYRVKEGPVSWHHVSNSKVNLMLDSLRMFIDILRVRNWHCTPINTFAKYMGPDEYRFMYEMEKYHWWFVSHRKLMIHLLQSLHLPPEPLILDAGSGTGSNILELNRFGKTFGIDISEKAVDFCFKAGLRNVIVSPLEKMPFSERMFDVVTCLDVLEHTNDPLEALAEIKRVLKDNGKLILTVPAFRILWSQHDDALCHLRRYEKESLISDLNEAGFKVEKIGYFFFVSFFIVASIRILRRFYFTGKIKSDTTTLPPKPLNKFFIALFRNEIRISDILNFPFGTTLYAVASKQTVSTLVGGV